MNLEKDAQNINNTISDKNKIIIESTFQTESSKKKLNLVIILIAILLLLFVISYMNGSYIANH